MRTSRILRATVLALAAAAAAPARPASAHGGRFLPPPGAPPTRPPGLLEPFDPSPPGPPTGAPGLTPPMGAPLSPRGPEDPTAPGRPTGPRRFDGARGVAAGGGWTDWWEANADALRASHRGARVVTGSAAGGAAAEADLLWSHVVEREVLPALRGGLEAESSRDPDVRASALLALGKTARAPEDVDRLLVALRRPGADPMERESAALALGLLRRSGPERTFDGRALDRVRGVLFDTIDDEKVHGRARCFAALALGLLGDQPATEGDAFGRDGRLVVRGLWTRLLDGSDGEEITVALLVALSLQPPRGVPEAVLAGLRAMAVSGRLGGRDRGALAQAHALLAFARLSDGGASGVLLGVLKGGSRDAHLRRSAILALGHAAPRLDPAQRAAAAEELCAHARHGDPDTAGLALIAAARCLAADAAAGSDVVATRGSAAQALLDAADHGAAAVRPFAALGLGLVLSPVEGTASQAPPCAASRARALAVLRDAAGDESTPADARGAFAIALGLAEDTASIPLLIGLVTRHGGDAGLRAHACAGLGLMGRPTSESLDALRRALAERSSDVLRLEASRALGLLGDVQAVPSLLEELRTAMSDHVRARAALALGSIRDPGAARALAVAVRDPATRDTARAIAMASLGLLGDLESPPTLARLAADSNYLAGTDALREALSLL